MVAIYDYLLLLLLMATYEDAYFLYSLGAANPK